MVRELSRWLHGHLQHILLGWNKIKDELIEFLSDHKSQRLAIERHNAIYDRYRQLDKLYYRLRSTMDLRQPFPAVGDLLLSKAIDELVWHTPFDQDLSDEFLYAKLADCASDIAPQWRAAKDLELLAVLREEIPTATESDFLLATTIFECHSCRTGRLQYPEMFYHQCCLFPGSLDHVDPKIHKWYHGAIRDNFEPKGLWRPQCLSFSKKMSKIATTIVEACNLDPAKTTAHDMFVANPLIECVDCKVEARSEPSAWQNFADKGRLFMRWPLPVSNPYFAREIAKCLTLLVRLVYSL